MASQVEMTSALPAAADAQSSLAREDLDRMLEFDRIIKFRDIVTSGKHPRIKIPAHMVPTNPRTTSSSPRSTLPSSVSDGAQGAPTSRPPIPDPSHNAHRAGNGLAIQGSSQGSVGMASFPGLGHVPTGPAAMNGRSSPAGGRRGGAKEVRLDPIFLEKSDGLVKAELSLQRARIEKKLREQLEEQRSQTSRAPQAREALPDFVIDDVLQEARVLEQSFTPPPIVPGTGRNNFVGMAAARAVAGAPDANGSPDDKTFYSSNFSTPEFGLTSRIPNESDNEVSMEDSSDYEPELDIVPSPMITAPPPPASSQTQQWPQQGGAATIELPSPRLERSSAVYTPGYHTSSQASAYEAPRPPSPFVHASDLSPVAPQPTHVSSLAQPLPSPVQVRPETLGRPAQVAMLRREEASQSSPDSSPQTTGSRSADKKKGKKKNNKRKAEQAATSPHIKAEPRSPSPILAPPAQRPPKRQRQAARSTQDASQYESYGHALRESYADSRAAYTPSQPLRDERIPVVYEQADPERYVRAGGAASRPIDLQQESPSRREWQVYRPSTFAPQYGGQPTRAPSGPPVAQYALPPSRADMHAVRAASHAFVEVSPDYSRPLYGTYSSVHEPGRVSVRPEAVVRERSRSPVMAPPGPSRPPYQQSTAGQQPRPPQTRIVVDEFGREYYEPARPATRQAAADAPPLRPRYESEIVYERVVPPQAIRASSQMPPAFEEDRMVYRRSSPVFAPPRRVATQPGYYEPPAGFLPREYPTQPGGSRPGLLPDERYEVRSSGQPPVPQFERRQGAEEPPLEYIMTRAASVRPPESVRYEVPAVGRYMERVGSVRPLDGGPPGGRDYPGPGPGAAGTPVYGSHVLEAPGASSYGDVHLDAPAREYSVRPGPAPYYVQQAPREPAPEFVYADGARREAYR